MQCNRKIRPKTKPGEMKARHSSQVRQVKSDLPTLWQSLYNTKMWSYQTSLNVTRALAILLNFLKLKDVIIEQLPDKTVNETQ